MDSSSTPSGIVSPVTGEELPALFGIMDATYGAPAAPEGLAGPVDRDESALPGDDADPLIYGGYYTQDEIAVLEGSAVAAPVAEAPVVQDEAAASALDLLPDLDNEPEFDFSFPLGPAIDLGDPFADAPLAGPAPGEFVWDEAPQGFAIQGAGLPLNFDTPLGPAGDAALQGMWDFGNPLLSQEPVLAAPAPLYPGAPMEPGFAAPRAPAPFFPGAPMAPIPAAPFEPAHVNAFGYVQPAPGPMQAPAYPVAGPWAMPVPAAAGPMPGPVYPGPGMEPTLAPHEVPMPVPVPPPASMTRMSALAEANAQIRARKAQTKLRYRKNTMRKGGYLAKRLGITDGPGPETVYASSGMTYDERQADRAARQAAARAQSAAANQPAAEEDAED